MFGTCQVFCIRKEGDAEKEPFEGVFKVNGCFLHTYLREELL